ncbi:U-box domain-containing protein 33-like isoform X2 [Durio zibethinus]|uniref:U-box domain-containing protein 33-like isoform X2 n=1 Tax=Durio zibethinus TaxID=66656 RepID=A0A6P5YAM8_DURZI|nr:U-box domain-containing protein 33-like isoform X2 [Durio zibethinus]
MEEGNYVPADSMQYYKARMMSPEIVEIGEESKSFPGSKDGSGCDVYVAVGKDDLGVLKWALDHAASPGSRVFLVHVFAPITFVRTPVGKLSKNQLNEEQLRVHVNEENNRRRNLLQKYIRLCIDSKVTVDTVLIESNSLFKAILELIPVLNITCLVMGTKHPPSSRQRRWKHGIAELIKKNAPDYCAVTIVHDGKKIEDCQQEPELVHPSQESSPQRTGLNSERNFFQCVCFTGKSN